MNDFGLNSASKVILTGMSAGGVATLLWADYLKSILPSTTAFVAAPDSGFAVDVFNFAYNN